MSTTPQPSVDSLYRQYLHIMKLREEDMSESEVIERKRTFFAGVGMILVYQADWFNERDEDAAVKLLDELLNETKVFFTYELLRQKS